jgi:DNA replication protein DnaC
MRRLPATRRKDCWKSLYGHIEKGSIIVTSNRPLEAWGKFLDRFLHHADVIKLDGKSYRTYDSREQRRQSTNDNLNEKGE